MDATKEKHAPDGLIGMVEQAPRPMPVSFRMMSLSVIHVQVRSKLKIMFNKSKEVNYV